MNNHGRKSGCSFPCCVGGVWFVVVVMLCRNKMVLKSIFMGIFLGLLKAKSQGRLRIYIITGWVFTLKRIMLCGNGYLPLLFLRAAAVFCPVQTRCIDTEVINLNVLELLV